ncbi:tyrosine-protein kinase receptor TYRO3-like isoform X2 [Biomphalaria glabrata]|uniref:Tyrosine-protein kinase receptor TYRO3-like isoform X2 n=1 Tax=Biomphalaria glabrata TaxID=6526 RepID=A0A9W3A221_BIOGL|nr:tyrosine-protein kinase receptor TYRO3-like isoform X2 [Biomphalaria glabrata]
MALYHFLCLYSFIIIIIIDPFNSASLASTLNTTSLQSGSTVENKQLCQWDVYFDCVSHRKDVSLYDQTLHLYGKNLSENWTSNFTIEIGGNSCQVLRILSGHLTCNITDINLFSRQLYSQSSTSTEASTMNTPWVKSPTEKKETIAVKVQEVKSETNEQREKTKPNYHQITDHFISYHVTVHSPQCIKSLGVLKISTASLTGRRPLYVGLVICTTILVTIVLLTVAVANKEKITLVKQRLQECKNKRLESLASMKINMNEIILKPKDITIGKLIGSGHFGCVYEGVLKTKDCCLKVAVKTVQDFSSGIPTIKAFIQEAVIMKHLQHPNVLQLIGLVEKQPGIPYVLLPYMEKGDLLTYVRTESVTLSLHEVLKFGADIASGMAYLSSLQFVHRDLAARNCMLDGLNTVKVADFGLCRDICEKGYYSSDNKKMLPIRWMAIESIEHGSYTTKSDVWSLGVVLWELLTRGLTPYPGVDCWDIINYLRYRRLPPPFFCPEQLSRMQAEAQM